MVCGALGVTEIISGLCKVKMIFIIILRNYFTFYWVDICTDSAKVMLSITLGDLGSDIKGYMNSQGKNPKTTNSFT